MNWACSTLERSAYKNLVEKLLEKTGHFSQMSHEKGDSINTELEKTRCYGVGQNLRVPVLETVAGCCIR